MKKVISLSLFLFLALSLFASNTTATNKKAPTAVSKSAKVEVFYFHYTRRCVTCQAVETESQKAITTLYAKEVKAGKVKFISVNLDEKSTKALAVKCKAEGQALLVISGSKRVDLTDKAFMYAKNMPEKLVFELKKSIDPLI